MNLVKSECDVNTDSSCDLVSDHRSVDINSGNGNSVFVNNVNVTKSESHINPDCVLDQCSSDIDSRNGNSVFWNVVKSENAVDTDHQILNSVNDGVLDQDSMEIKPVKVEVSS